MQSTSLTCRWSDCLFAVVLLGSPALSWLSSSPLGLVYISHSGWRCLHVFLRGCELLRVCDAVAASVGRSYGILRIRLVASKVTVIVALDCNQQSVMKNYLSPLLVLLIYTACIQLNQALQDCGMTDRAPAR